MLRIILYISRILALMLVLPLHEFAHAFAAVKSGDNTPKIYGRYTINPLAHFDPIGVVCFVLVGFGWAKPVPINPNNFNNYKKGCFFTSIAGVAANYLLAFIAYPLMILSFGIPEFGYFDDVVKYTLIGIVNMSLSFFIFNLIPVYPLDGFRVVDVFCKKRGSLYWFLKNKGMYILYALFALGIVADITGISRLDVLGTLIGYVYQIIEIPIYLFWELIF